MNVTWIHACTYVCLYYNIYAHVAAADAAVAPAATAYCCFVFFSGGGIYTFVKAPAFVESVIVKYVSCSSGKHNFYNMCLSPERGAISTPAGPF